MKLRPLNDLVLVEEAPAEEVSKGGIILAPVAQEKPNEGKVVAKGKGAILPDGTIRPLDLQVGDRVLFGKYAGTEVKIDGAKYQMLRESEILGVLE